MSLAVGTLIFDRYEVEGPLGVGGMGAVFRARHHRLDLPVALKVLHDRDEELKVRFEREAQLMAKVRHPNVVSILDYGFLDDGSPCIAMELIEGEGLDALLKRSAAVPWTSAAEWIQGLCAGLAAMHAQHVLHRDLKPANLVLSKTTPTLLKIIDFGIAKPTGNDATKLTQTDAIVGTPAYMSPEQLLGYELDGRSDLYSAGIILYEMLVGGRPGAGGGVTEVMRRIQSPIPPPRAPASLPPLPDALVEIVLSTCDADPANRPASAAELSQRLARAVASAPADTLGHTLDSTQSMAASAARAMAGVDPTGELATNIQRPPSSVSAARAAAPATVGMDEESVVTNRMERPSPETLGMDEDSVLTNRMQRPAAPPATPPSVMRPPHPAARAPVATPAVAPPPSTTKRFLIAAKLPPSRLANRDERGWLADLVSLSGRGFTLGANLWFAWGASPQEPGPAREEAERLLAALGERYGSTVDAVATLAEADFSVSSAALSGAAPLPEALRKLMSELGA